MATSTDGDKHVSLPDSKPSPNGSHPTSTSGSPNNGRAEDESQPGSEKQTEDTGATDEAADESQYERSRAKIALIMLAIGVSFV